MCEELRLLHDRIGATTVYVTHDQIEAMSMADRICIMNKGEVLQIGPPSEVYARPATRFVAGFIGSPAMNFLAGEGGLEAGQPARRAGQRGSRIAVPRCTRRWRRRKRSSARGRSIFTSPIRRARCAAGSSAWSTWARGS